MPAVSAFPPFQDSFVGPSGSNNFGEIRYNQDRGFLQSKARMTHNPEVRPFRQSCGITKIGWPAVVQYPSSGASLARTSSITSSVQRPSGSAWRAFQSILFR